ncbi:hypothetical protein [Lacticaseibacillus saniviri]|nr:hypothetical protein [Lacticaseibacillus saniviri]
MLLPLMMTKIPFTKVTALAIIVTALAAVVMMPAGRKLCIFIG